MNYEDKENLFSAAEVDTLRKVRSSDGLALSVYLDLRSMYRKKNVLDMLKNSIRDRLESLGITSENARELQEDIDLIALYLTTRDNIEATGIIVFSCARKLFWRAYPLSIPIEMHLHIGSQLDIEPLMELLESQNVDSVAFQRMAV